MTVYLVWQHHYGRKLITSNCPAQGLLEWPQHQWRSFAKHRSKAKAIEASKACETHSQVSAESPDGLTETIFDNGKPALIPSGWYHPEAQTSADARRAA